MPILHNSLVPVTGKEDPVVRSLRFNGAISSSEAGHLYRTAGTPTDEGKWTMSMWVKVGQQPTNGYMTLFGAGSSNDNAAYAAIYNGTLYADQATSSNHRTIRCSERLLRDPGAWYHLCFAYDNSQSGSSGNNQNAYKWYVNGVRLTEPTYSNNESVTGYTHRFNSSGYIQRIGKNAHRSYNSTYKYHWDGLIANVHFVDGQQLEPTEFIEANDYGGYIPKEYTGTYGNNGFHIDAQPNNVDGELLISSISRNDGDTTFADSAQGHGLTVGSDPKHSIKVGNPHTGSDRAVYFNGSADYLTVPSSADFNFGSNNCTFEGWFLFEGFDENPDGIFSRNSTGSQGWSVCTDSSGQLEFFESTNNTYHESGFTFKTGVWYHIALSRKGNTYRVYVDGNEKIEAFLSSTPDQSVPLTIGAFYDNYAGYRLKGYCYDFRVSNGGDSYYPVDLTLPTETPSVESDTILQLDHKESGNTTATTSGSSTPSWTVNGSVHHSVGAGTPFSSDDRAIYFDGTDDYLTVDDGTNIDLGTGDFTIEFWVNSDENTQNAFITGRWNATPNGGAWNNREWGLTCSSYGSGGLDVYISSGGASYGGSITTCDSKWHHIAIVRSSGDAKLYVDGEYKYDPTVLDSLNMSFSSKLIIGAGQATYWRGAMYDYRISDTARYSSNFDLPTEKFTSDSNTLLLIQPDKGDTTFHDESSSPATVTTVGSPTRSASTPFEDADKATSLYFDGSNDDITTGTDFIMGHADDHTFETWFYTTKNDSQYLYCHNYSQHYEGVTINPNASSSGTVIGLGGNNNNWSPVLGSEATISLNTWHHLAIVILNGQVHFYLDGVLKSVDTTHSAWTGNPSNTTIGSQRYVNGSWRYHFQGYLRDMRISDTAKYRGNFTPPSSNLQSDSNTKLLIQPNNTDTAIGDETSNHTITGYGDNTDGSSSSFVTPVASTPYDAAAKSTAMFFDGVNDYVETTGSSDFAFGTGDFTIEGWYYFLNIPSGNDLILVDTRPNNDGTTTAFSFSTDTTNGVKIYSGSSYALGGSLSTNTWHHIALVRDSGTLYAYIDGVPTGTTQTYTNNLTTNGTPRLGATAGGTHARLNGYVFDVRITKGTARYTSSFTAPSGPFELNPVYLGADQSGNNNHFDATNISLTHDVVLDNPFKNYATINPLNGEDSSHAKYGEGNLHITYNNAGQATTFGATMAFPKTGKWYAEVYIKSYGSSDSTRPKIGICRSDYDLTKYNNDTGQLDSADCFHYQKGGNKGGNSAGSSSYGASHTTGDIIGVAFDSDNGTLTFYKNGTSQGQAFSGLTKEYILATSGYDTSNSGTDDSVILNFGQDPSFAGNYTETPDSAEWAHSPPAGFKSLNTSNLDDPPAIPSENFGISMYNGNSQSNPITGLGFQPDVLWTKSRSTSGSSPKIFDSIRGVTKRLQPDSTAVEQTVSELTSFDSDGFTLGSDSGSNYSGRTYAGWCWKAHQSPGSSSTRTTYTVKVEDNSGDAWDYSGSYYDSSTYLPSVYMEIFENRNNSLVSLGKVAVRYYDSSGNSNSDLSEQTYTLECADLNAIAVKWHYDTSGDGQEWDYPNYYNDYLNDQKITILDGTTSEWTTNNHSNDDGTSSNYSPPTGWANGDTLKSATTSYNGSDTATLTSSSGGSSGPTEKYNAGAGFTIISYSGDGSSGGDTQNINHSLGVPLEFVLAKNRTSNNSNTNGDWIVWHKDLPSYKFLKLNSNQTTRTSSYGDLISTAVSGSQHQVVVANDYDSNSSTYHYLNDGGYYGTAEEYILYGWATTPGMCKVGSYEGNGNSDGPFLAMDFAPAFFLYTNIDSSEHWYITYNKNKSYNVSSRNAMFAGHSNKESTESRYQMDFLSNGVKIRATHAKTNANNKTYLYLAMAEMPFKYGNGK